MLLLFTGGLVGNRLQSKGKTPPALWAVRLVCGSESDLDLGLQATTVFGGGLRWKMQNHIM